MRKRSRIDPARLRVHKIKLCPTSSQANYFARACGVARFAWNWALAEWNRQCDAGVRPNEAALRKQLNAVKRAEFPWMLEVTKCAAQQAIRNLGKAFSRFFAGDARRPRFKRKGQRDSFLADSSGGTLRCQGKAVTLAVVGTVKMAEELRFTGRLVSATVSRTAGRWFVAIQVEIPESAPAVCENQATVGVDLGVSSMATCSDGQVFANPMPLRKRLKRLKRAGRRVSRKVKGSRNRRKAVARLAQEHYRVACVRQDSLHKATTGIVGCCGTVVLEDLNVRGMAANRCLSRAISDVGLREFRRQVEYKARRAGVTVLLADRWFPSTKLCSGCGNLKDEMPLGERVYRCAACGLEIDRDLNAARNLAALARASPSTVRLTGIHAWGVRSSDAAPAGSASAGRRTRNSEST